MARKRFIKPEFFGDPDLAEVSIEARFLYAGMWPWMDRQGLIEASAKVHRANVFPHDEKITAAKVQGWIDELVAGGFVKRFSWRGKDLLFCPTFPTHQRLFPDERALYDVPAETLASLTDAGVPAQSHPSSVTVPSQSLHSTVQEPDKEKEEEKEEEEERNAQNFESIYDTYPRKRGKEAGLKRLNKRYGNDPKAFTQFAAAVRGLIHEIKMQRTDPKFVPYFSTFVGTDDAEPWRDYVPPEKPTPPAVAVPVQPEKPAEQYTPEVGAQAIAALSNIFKNSNRMSGAS